MECWEPSSLMAIRKAIGMPLHIDNTTPARENGYYAMVLCDMDLSKEHLHCILVEVEDSEIKFWHRVELGRLPDFHHHCKKYRTLCCGLSYIEERFGQAKCTREKWKNSRQGW